MKRAWQTGLLLALAALGCDGGAAPVPKATTPAGIKRRAVTELPKIGDYQPPLDESRLEVAPPAGWILTGRARTFLMGFSPPKTTLPRISINAEDPPPGSPKELTEEDAAALAAQLDADMRKANRKLLEASLPIQLGETLFIRHVRQVSLEDAPCVVQSLQTIKNGRLYTVDLVVEIDAPRAEDYEDSLVKYRDYGYAVAANMRFAQPGEKFDPLAGVKLPQAKAEKTPPPKAAVDKTKATPPPDSKTKTTPPTKPPATKSPAAKTEPKPKPPTPKPKPKPVATDKTNSAKTPEDKTP